MNVTLRSAVPVDVAECGRICYEAFRTLADQHGFARDFPSADIAVGVLGMLINHPGFYGVVAEANDTIIGSNFMDERSRIFGIGPISVDPTVQDKGIGRLLMKDVLRRASEQQAAGVRLVQAGYHNRSLHSTPLLASRRGSRYRSCKARR
jgi:GNAT superfamily N-acetyltransferase